MSDLTDRLRWLSRNSGWGDDATARDAADALDAQAKEIEELRAELDLRRKSGSATDRLHNLCESIAADADGSEFSREEWDRIDAENVALKAANRDLIAHQQDLRAEVEALRLDAGRGRYMIEHGCWHRGDEQTHLAVLVPNGSDLSCYAMREAAIDAAMAQEQKP